MVSGLKTDEGYKIMGVSTSYYSMKYPKYFLLTIMVYSLVGAFLVRNSSGVPSISWMYIYNVADFDSFGKNLCLSGCCT